MNHSSRGLLQAFNHRFMLLQHLGIFFVFLPGSLEKHQVSYLETKIFCHQPTLTVSKGCPTSTPAAPETKQTAWL